MPSAVLDAPPTTMSAVASAPKPDQAETVSNGAWPLALNFRPAINMTDDEFFTFCQINGDLHIERDANGKILFMAPAGGGSSSRNGSLSGQIYIWARADATGKVFDSSGGFILPNSAQRAPDASWVLKTRLEPLSAEQKEKFLPLCPDFVAEIRSPSDALAPLQAKMEEYRQNGARLGWLIDPQNRQVHVYREGQTSVEILDAPVTVSGETVLPGFVLQLADIWNPF